jgi:hypothetical protein
VVPSGLNERPKQKNMQMKIALFIIVIWIKVTTISAQQSWTGTYTGTLDRDQIILTLTTTGKNAMSGTMTDSANKYDVNGTYKGNTFTGTANEKTLGLTFEMMATLNGNTMQTTLILDVFGSKEKMEILFTKKATETKSLNIADKTVKSPVDGKSRDPQVIGTWVKESNYNSGYGFNDSYGSMSVSEKMEFLADGSMSDGGSSAHVSGSNYAGNSTSNQVNKIEGLSWYTSNKKIYLVATQNQQSQTIELGKYFIENNKMLITGTNGEKLLLTKR